MVGHKVSWRLAKTGPGQGPTGAPIALRPHAPAVRCWHRATPTGTPSPCEGPNVAFCASPSPGTAHQEHFHDDRNVPNLLGPNRSQWSPEAAEHLKGAGVTWGQKFLLINSFCRCI